MHLHSHDFSAVFKLPKREISGNFASDTLRDLCQFEKFCNFRNYQKFHNFQFRNFCYIQSFRKYFFLSLCVLRKYGNYRNCLFPEIRTYIHSYPLLFFSSHRYLSRLIINTFLLPTYRYLSFVIRFFRANIVSWPPYIYIAF